MNFSANIIDLLYKQDRLEMESETVELDKEKQVMPLDMVSIKEIIISPEDRDFIVNNLSEEAAEIYSRVRRRGASAHIIPHAYNNVEYHCKQNKLFVSRSALYYIKKNPEADIPMNVIGAETLKKKLGPIDKQKIELPEYEFPKYDKAVVTKFKETTYKRLSQDVAILYTNLPYDYYKDIYITDKAFYHDIDADKDYFCFEEMGSDAYKELFDKVVNGMSPVAMKVRHGRVVGVENIAPLVIAKYLQLPSIPAIVVADAEVDEYEQVVPPVEDLTKANETFAPYFMWAKE